MKKLMCIMLLILLVGCSPKQQTKTTDFECSFMDINHEKTSGVDIYYDNIKVASSNSEGKAFVTITSEQAFNKSLLKFVKEGFQFYIFDTTTIDEVPQYLVIGNADTEPANWYDNLFTVSGKIVLHQDGETRISGAKLIINNKRIVEVKDGNYEIKYVYKGFTIRVEHEDYKFVDISGEDKDSYVIEKTISGLTFRGVSK